VKEVSSSSVPRLQQACTQPLLTRLPSRMSQPRSPHPPLGNLNGEGVGMLSRSDTVVVIVVVGQPIKGAV
jgi:hypothetical protein